jgi:hypothetical protein
MRLVVILLTLLEPHLSFGTVGVEAKAFGVFRRALGLVGAGLDPALVDILCTLLDAPAVYLGGRWRRPRGRDDGLGGALGRRFEAVFVWVVAQASSILGSTLSHVGARLSDTRIMSVSTLFSTLLRGDAVVGKSRGDERRNDDGGTHVDELVPDYLIVFLFLCLPFFWFNSERLRRKKKRRIKAKMNDADEHETQKRKSDLMAENLNIYIPQRTSQGDWAIHSE